MNALEYEGLNRSVDPAFSLFVNIEVLRSDNDVDKICDAFREFREKRVDALERDAARKNDFIVLLHGARNDIGFADEVSNICVLGFIVDIDRCSDLLDDAVLHDDDRVGHRERLFLIVGNINESDAEFSLHLLKLDLHLLTHLKVQSSQRLVQKKDPRAVNDGSCDGNSLHLSA